MIRKMIIFAILLLYSVSFLLGCTIRESDELYNVNSGEVSAVEHVYEHESHYQPVMSSYIKYLEQVLPRYITSLS